MSDTEKTYQNDVDRPEGDNRTAVVLLSGGLDSATVLALARQQGYQCHAISIDYGQRHRAELNAATQLADTLGAAQHLQVNVDLRAIGGSALTAQSIDVPESSSSGIPVTYVPARNTVFLSIALGYAETLEAGTIFIGANAVDYSGYPDCRPAFIDAFEQLANVATKAAIEGRPIKINAPLIDMTKAQIILAGIEAGVDYALTVSCYQADQKGFACGRCDSCTLRRQGFMDARVQDPTRYQTAV